MAVVMRTTTTTIARLLDLCYWGKTNFCRGPETKREIALEPAYGGHSRPESEPKISNSALGMIAFIGTELMFFAALIYFLIINSYGGLAS